MISVPLYLQGENDLPLSRPSDRTISSMEFLKDHNVVGGKFNYIKYFGLLDSSLSAVTKI